MKVVPILAALSVVTAIALTTSAATNLSCATRWVAGPYFVWQDCNTQSADLVTGHTYYLLLQAPSCSNAVPSSRGGTKVIRSDGYIARESICPSDKTVSCCEHSTFSLQANGIYHVYVYNNTHGTSAFDCGPTSGNLSDSYVECMQNGPGH